MTTNEPEGSMILNLPGLRSKKHHAIFLGHFRPSSSASDRSPFMGFLPDSFRNHFIAMLGEFAGTFLFLFFAFAGTQVANTKAPDAPIASAPDPASLLYIALCFGFSLAVNAWVFFRISGGLFNPAGLIISKDSSEMDLDAYCVYSKFFLNGPDPSA
ncbi:Aquaporin-1 [Xanthoria calcicola]